MNARTVILPAAAVAFLLAMAASGEQPAVENLPDPLQAGWKGSQVCEVLHEDASQRVLRCTFPPGGGHERHFHAPHFGYVLAGGQMRIKSATGVRDVDLSDDLTWTSEGVDWHEVENIGETTSVYLIIEPR